MYHSDSYFLFVVVIDKTAEFVAKSGKQLEERILIAEASNPKFAFMRPGNVYFAYYQLKMRDFKRAENPDAETSADPAPAASGMYFPFQLATLLLRLIFADVFRFSLPFSCAPGSYCPCPAKARV